MKIDENRVMEAFASYVKNYDPEDEKIKLKIVHTYHVAGLCRQIAQSLHLNEGDVQLAWLLGMLHDVGRFEQLRRYGTFSDADSIDHAMFGAELLFGSQQLFRDYVDVAWERTDKDEMDAAQGMMDVDEMDATEDGTAASERDDGDSIADEGAKTVAMIRTAIETHSAYRLPEDLDERTRMFCQILRDADKIDILRVNVEVPLEEIYNTTTEALHTATVTPEVMEAFSQEHAVLRSLKKTPVDHVVGHMALVFKLVYPISVRVVKEQGYLRKLMEFSSDSPITQRQFETLRSHMNAYMESKA